MRRLLLKYQTASILGGLRKEASITFGEDEGVDVVRNCREVIGRIFDSQVEQSTYSIQ